MIAPRCTHWPDGGKRCEKAAMFYLYAPDGERVPGSRLCAEHLRVIVDEYREKLGETWRGMEIPEEEK